MTVEQSPEYVISNMVALHRELGEFLVYLNMNSKVIKNYKEGTNAIDTISEMIETEVRRLQVHIEQTRKNDLSTGDVSTK